MDEFVSEFVDITGCDIEQAQFYYESTGGDLDVSL
jgi:hypothetical protein